MRAREKSAGRRRGRRWPAGTAPLPQPQSQPPAPPQPNPSGDDGHLLLHSPSSSSGGLRGQMRRRVRGWSGGKRGKVVQLAAEGSRKEGDTARRRRKVEERSDKWAHAMLASQFWLTSGPKRQHVQNNASWAAT
ncbi:unnamed protein product [Urochloa humidicola]